MIWTTRRWALAGAAMAALMIAGAATAQPADANAKADAIQHRILTLDSHVDVSFNPATDQASLAKLKAGGVDAVAFAVFAPTGPDTPEGYAKARTEAQRRLAAIKAIAADHPNDAEIALSAADVRRIVGAHKEAILISFLDAYWLKGDVAEFDKLYGDGVRIAGLDHIGNTAFADSSRVRPGEKVDEHGGLTPAGEAAVRKLNDLGVLVDVSQLSTKALDQTLAITRVPVVATHSDVRALVENTRNLSDAEIDAIAAKGGVIQTTPFQTYLSPPPADYDVKMAALRAQYGLPPGMGDIGMEVLAPDKRAAFFAAYRGLKPKASVKQYVDHIDYIVKRVGIDHVGVGTDFNHGAGIIGFTDESEAGNVTRELVARGYSEADIAKIWGGNFLRVLAAAEAGRKQ